MLILFPKYVNFKALGSESQYKTRKFIEDALAEYGRNNQAYLEDEFAYREFPQLVNRALTHPKDFDYISDTNYYGDYGPIFRQMYSGITKAAPDWLEFKTISVRDYPDKSKYLNARLALYKNRLKDVLAFDIKNAGIVLTFTMGTSGSKWIPYPVPAIGDGLLLLYADISTEKVSAFYGGIKVDNEALDLLNMIGG